MSDDARLNGRIADMLPRLWPLVALILIVAVIALAASFAPAVLQRRATQGLIDLIAVVGLYVFAAIPVFSRLATSRLWRSVPTSRRS
jgi:Mg2+/citrate symporter